MVTEHLATIRNDIAVVSTWIEAVNEGKIVTMSREPEYMGVMSGEATTKRSVSTASQSSLVSAETADTGAAAADAGSSPAKKARTKSPVDGMSAAQEDPWKDPKMRTARTKWWKNVNNKGYSTAVEAAIDTFLLRPTVFYMVNQSLHTSCPRCLEMFCNRKTRDNHMKDKGSYSRGVLCDFVTFQEFDLRSPRLTQLATMLTSKDIDIKSKRVEFESAISEPWYKDNSSFNKGYRWNP